MSLATIQGRPDVPKIVSDYRTETEDADAERAMLRARWRALPECDRERIEADVQLANPGLIRFQTLLVSLYFDAMLKQFGGV